MSIIASETKELSEGIILHKQAINTNIYEFYLEINRLNSVEVTSDFSDSENLYIEGTSKLLTTTTVHPFSKTKIATLKLLDDWSIKSKFKCKIIDPPKAIIIDAIKREKNEISLKLKNSKSIFTKILPDLSPLNEVEKLLSSNNLNFIDNDFPPVDFLDKISFAWKRLSHAYPNALVLSKNIGPFDLLTGQSKDIHIKSALAVLAERPACIERLFITKVYNPYGIYRVKLCKNNEWQIVTIDDYVPFLLNGKCLLTVTIDNSFWATLLEKAYCKLFGSYNILNFSSISEILADFTGCPTDSIIISNAEPQILWETICESLKKGFLCVFSKDENFFSLLKTEIAEEKAFVLCRNTENFEWKGKWLENSKLWTGKIKEKVNPIFENLSFWIENNEIPYFDKLIISKIGHWHEFRFKGKFVKKSEKTISNTYYSITLQTTTDITITIQQEDEKDSEVQKLRPYMDIGIVILKTEDNSLNILYKKDLVIDRSLSIQVNLDPGDYIILPMTSGCLLRSPLEISPEKQKLLNSDGNLTALFESTLKDIFNKSETDKVIKFEKFRKIFEAFGKNITEAEFKQKVLKKFLNKDEGLPFFSFKNFFLEQTKTLPEDQIWTWLEKLGYDRDFYSVRSRLYSFSLYSDTELSVFVNKNVAGLEDQINVFLIQNQGVEIESKAGIKVLYYLHADVHCYLYGICNFQDDPIEATLNCSESENMVFSIESTALTKFVAARDFVFMFSAIALPNVESFVRSARCTW